MDHKIYASCPDCGSPVTGSPHTPRVCVELLKLKLDESERELRIAEGTVEWIVKTPENVRAL